jgi:hypothetical protein
MYLKGYLYYRLLFLNCDTERACQGAFPNEDFCQVDKFQLLESQVAHVAFLKLVEQLLELNYKAVHCINYN